MFKRSLFTALGAIALTLGMSTPALACGGFFCFTQPVDQSAERILYVHENGKITLHVQISYKGDDQNFSWVLPLSKAPLKTADGKDLAVGSDTIFQRLEQYTSPTFYLNWKQNGTCNGPQCYAEDATRGGPGGTKNGGVEVLAQDSVGPYDYALLQGSSGTDIVNWLNENKFVQPTSTVPLIQSYAQKSYVFLALKLKKDSSAGDLVPVSITVAEDSPCLPIRLTALATQPDMPIVAWFLDKSRAIPKNYLHVELNEAAVDWLTNGGNYKSVVSKAVDQGSGHAFLTEMAKKTSDIPIPFANPQWDVSKLSGITDPAKFLATMFAMQLPSSTQMQNLIKKYIKKPAEFSAVSDSEFYNCIQNTGSGMTDAMCKKYVDAAVAAGFDGAALAADLDLLVFKPLQTLDVQYKAAGWLTRMYTTLSAEEMTKDPTFAVNPDLPEVGQQHTADAEPICEAGSNQASQVKITFKDGFVLTVPVDKNGQNNCGYYYNSVSLQSAATNTVAGGGQPLGKLQVLEETGAPIAIDQSAADKVDAELNKAVLGKQSLSAAFLATLPKVTWNAHTSSAVTPPTASSSSDGGCTTGPHGSLAGLAALLLGALAAVGLVRNRKRP